MGRNLNKGGEGIKNGSHQGDPKIQTRVVYFNVPTVCLCLSVACILEKKVHL